MTYRYSDINQHDALYTAARKYPGGIECLYKRLDLPSSARLYNKLRPGVELDHMDFEEVSLVIENLQDAGKHEAAELPIQAFNWRHGYIAVKRWSGPPVASGDLLKMMCNVMATEGEVALAISSALSDNWISPAEQERIKLAIRRAAQVLMELEQRVHERRGAPREK